MVRPSARSKAIRTAKASKTATARSTTVPVPPADLYVSPTYWPRGKPIHRIHLACYAADEFNPGRKGDARFSPIVDAGAAVPTLYGGSTFDCAAIETVFHDVPFAPGFKSYDKRKLEGHIHSVLLPATDLVLADLSNVALRKLGVPRVQLIDTEKDCYPDTRKWAAAIHARIADIQGLCWTSRQDDRALAIVLFGDRVADKVLIPAGSSRELLDDASAYVELLALADRIGVTIIAGKS